MNFLWKLFSPITATVAATICCIMLIPRSFVGEMVHDFCYRWPKWWMILFWSFWMPGAFYYQWVNIDERGRRGGAGPARWMWRQPKHPRWQACGDWWVFNG